MKTMPWYRARIRWAEMVEGRGIRHWEEGLVFVSQRKPRGGIPARFGNWGRRTERRGRRWSPAALGRDALGGSSDAGLPGGERKEEEPLEVHWIRMPATEKIAFEHGSNRPRKYLAISI